MTFVEVVLVIQGCTKRWTPGLVNLRRKSCALLPAAGRRTQFLPAASRSIRGYVCSSVRSSGTVSKKGEFQFEGFPELLQMIKRNANLRDFPELLQFLYASTSS